MIWQAIAILFGAQYLKDRFTRKKLPPQSAAPESQPPRPMTALEKIERYIDDLIELPGDPIQPQIPAEESIGRPIDQVGDLREQFGNFRSPESGAGDVETGRTSQAALQASVVHPPPTIRTAPFATQDKPASAPLPPLRSTENFFTALMPRIFQAYK